MSIPVFFATSPAFISLFQYLKKHPGLQRSKRFSHLMEAFSTAKEEALEKIEYLNKIQDRLISIYNLDHGVLCDLDPDSDWKCDAGVLSAHVFSWETWEL